MFLVEGLLSNVLQAFIFVLRSMGKMLFMQHSFFFSCNTLGGHWKNRCAGKDAVPYPVLITSMEFLLVSNISFERKFLWK